MTSTAVDPRSRTSASMSAIGADWSPTRGHPQRWWILIVLAAVVFMAQLDMFIVNIAVPAMGRSFAGAGLSSLSWVLNAYAVVFAALLVPAGRLADHFGRRRFLLSGVVTFTLASVLCAAAPTLGLLVAGRVIQAIGAALIVPTSLGLLLPAFPASQHSKVVGIWAGVAAVAASAGLPVGGLLVGLDWRWIFLINLPIGVATLTGGLRVLPEVRANPGARLPDAISAAALLAAITLLILATVQGPGWGWTSPATIALYSGAAAAIALTVQRTIRHPHALIEATLFRSREFTSAAIALFLFFIAFAAWLLVTVLFLQNVWHYSAMQAGLAIAPGPLTAAVFAVNSGRIVAHVGRSTPAIVGSLCVAASAVFWLVATPAHPAYLRGFLPGLVVAGVGAGLTQGPLFAAAGSLPADRATTGSAVLNMSRQVGSAVGIAVLVALLGSPHPSHLGQFHRGWILQLATAASAALAIVVLRRRGQSPPAEEALTLNTRTSGPTGSRSKDQLSSPPGVYETPVHGLGLKVRAGAAGGAAALNPQLP
jgi:EmrB/QacA subfamily drug resistance transporter